MPNIKSAKKRVLVNEKKNEENKMIKSSVKTAMKKIEALIKEGKIEEAKALLPETFKVIDSACSKGVIHKNNAANKYEAFFDENGSEFGKTTVRGSLTVDPEARAKGLVTTPDGTGHVMFTVND